MTLQSIVNVQIDVQTASVERAGFGTALIMSNEANGIAGFPRARLYTDTAGMVTDGFSSTGAAVVAATALLAQSFRPDEFVIGRRDNLTTLSKVVTPIAKDSTLYRVTLNGTNFDFTSGVSATPAEIATGLDIAINAGAEPVTSVDGTGFITLTADVAGEIFTMAVDRSLLTQDDTTADPGVQADLTAIRTAIDGNDDWYALILDSHATLEYEALNADIEAVEKIMLGASSDDDIITSSITDLASTLQALSLRRTSVFFHPDAHTFPEAAWAGEILPRDPGSATWKFKTLATVAFTKLTPAEKAFAQGKNANFYQRLAGNNITCDGVMAGGEFIDITRFIDFISARIRENVFLKLKVLPKVPFTDDGIAIVEAEVLGVMDLGIAVGGFAADPEPVVTAPRAADVSQNDKAQRLLPDVKFSATLAGAIHTVEVRGTVTV